MIHRLRNDAKSNQPRFSPVFGPFCARVGVRVRVRRWVGLGFVGSTSVS